MDKYIIDYRDSSYNALFTFQWDKNNNLEITQRVIDRHEISTENDLYKTVYDTSYSIIGEYSWKKDTVLKTSDSDFSFIHTMDTTLWIYERNRLIKNIKTSNFCRHYFSRIIWSRRYDVTELYYNINDQVFKTIYYRYERDTQFYDSSFVNVLQERFSIGPDTTFISYDNNGFKISEKTICQDGFGTISFYKKSKTSNRIKEYYYFATKKFRPRKLISLSIIDYNDKELPIVSREYDISSFLGIRIRRIYSEKSFEYIYWK
jgi:hypothetical protein